MKLLIVEDEPRMVELLARGLGEEGHAVTVAGSVAQALEFPKNEAFDVIVLDWSLPDGDGLALLTRWRDAGINVPVLMLTARGSAPDRVIGLRAGADDYLPKPFLFEELVARLEALARRHGRARAVATSLGDVVVREADRLLTCGTASVELTVRELDLFRALAASVGRTMPRREILDRVWGAEFQGDPNVIDVYVGYLRGKLERLGPTQLRLSTVRGVGFRLDIAASP